MNRGMQLLLRILGIAISLVSVWYGFNGHEAIAEGSWLHTPSLVLVCGCIIGFCLASYQMNNLIDLANSIIFRSPSILESQLRDLGRELKPLSEQYYARGTSALSPYAQNAAFPDIWRNILTQLEAKIPPRDIRTMLQYDAKRMQDHLGSQIQILTALASISPSVGMLGTVIGLVRLLGNMQDMAALGPNMAMAMLSTLYGIFFNVVIFNPMSSRMQTMRELRQKAYNQALFWLYLVENHKPLMFSDESSFHDKKKTVGAH